MKKLFISIFVISITNLLGYADTTLSEATMMQSLLCQVCLRRVFQRLAFPQMLLSRI